MMNRLFLYNKQPRQSLKKPFIRIVSKSQDLKGIARIALSAFFILFGNNLLNAQEFKASAPAVVQTGQAFNYSLNGNRQGSVELPEMKGIRLIAGPGQSISTQSSNVNGRLQTVTNVAYTFALMIDEVGEYEIPGAKITSGGKVFTSNAIRISAIKGTSQVQSTAVPDQGQGNESVLLKIIPSRRDIFIGEQILVETKVLVRENLQVTGLDEPKYDGFWREEIKADNFMGNDVVNGKSYRTQVIGRDLLTAQKAGSLKIAPARMDVMLRKKVKSQRNSGGFDDFFNDPFFRDPFERFENVPASFTSNPITINVKPLPSGAPSTFTGAVGQFSFNASLSRDSLQANESLNLKITIKGNGNLSLIDIPKVDFPPDLEVFEPKTNSSLTNSTQGTSGIISFEYLIIPRNQGDYRISPIEFSWFDPSSVTYKTVKSEEFNFKVRGQTEGEGEGDANQIAQGFFRDEVKDINADIRYIKTDPGTLHKKRLNLLRTGWLMVYPLGILLLVVLLVIRRKSLERRANARYIRNRKANKMAAKRLANARKLMAAGDDNFYDEILKAFWGYFSDKLGINTSELSREKIHEKLKIHNVPGEFIGSLWELLDECEYSRYAKGARSDKAKIYHNAVKRLSDIEQIL